MFHTPGDRLRDTLFLNKCAISLAVDGLCFTLNRPGGKPITLKAGSRDERSDWLKSLTNAKQLLDGQQTHLQMCSEYHKTYFGSGRQEYVLRSSSVCNPDGTRVGGDEWVRICVLAFAEY